jgi:hypothetical protein
MSRFGIFEREGILQRLRQSSSLEGRNKVSRIRFLPRERPRERGRPGGGRGRVAYLVVRIRLLPRDTRYEGRDTAAGPLLASPVAEDGHRGGTLARPPFS